MRLRATSRWSAVAAVALAGVGCVTYKARPLQPAESAARLEARRLDSPSLRACMETVNGQAIESWPPAPWGFSELTAAATCWNPRLSLARAELETTRAELVTAGARQEPALGVTAEYQSNAGRGLSPWTVGPTIDVPLTTAGKREIRVSRVRNLVEAARLDLMTVAWQVRSDVRAALVALAVAEQTGVAVREEIGARADVLRGLEAQRAAGAAAAPEVAAARAQLDALRLDAAGVEGEVAAAKAAPAAALGVRESAVGGVAIEWWSGELPDDPAQAGGRALALRSRTDVLAALARYEVSQEDVRLAVADQYPDLHLGPGFLWDQGASRWQLGLSLVLPLIEGNRGPIGEAEARRAREAVRFEALQANVVEMADLAEAELAAGVAGLAAAREAEAEHLQLVASVRRMLAAGAVTRLELRLEEAALHQAERVRIEKWGAAQRALGRLEDALQAPLGGSPPAPAVPLADPAEEEKPVP